MKRNFQNFSNVHGNFFLISLLSMICIPVSTSSPDDVIMVNSKVTGRVYEGIGSLSAGASSRLLIDYPEPYRSQILDYLFKPMFGASLNHLKTEIGGDVNSTCGTESSHQHTRNDENFERGYEWWLMKEARRRNGNIVLDVLAWGAPYWIGNGKYYSDDLPEYMAKFIMGAKQVHDLDIDYIGIWNESPYDINYIKQLRKVLDKYNIRTQISAADEIRSYGIVKDMLKDTGLYNSVDVIGTHYAHGQGNQLYGGKSVYELYGKDHKIVWPEALDCGKPIWSQEDGPWNGEWKGAKGLIKVLIRNYIDAKMVKTITWSLITSYHDNIGIPESGLMRANTPWSGNYEVQPALWAMAHFTQFIEPGWIFLEGGANGYLSQGGSYVSLMSPDKQHVSIVIETVESGANERVQFNLAGTFAGRALHVWKSDSLDQFMEQPDVINPVEGSLRLTLDKGAIYTLTTTTGQQKGNPNLSIPGASLFPLPYSDDFSKYDIEKLPKYTSDISGVFEIAYDKNNKVLKQVVPERGIEWLSSLNAEPFTIIGDMNMDNYAVSIDVKLEKKGETAHIMGRIPYIIQGQVIPPMGYCLKVNTNGQFILCSTMPALLAGWSDYRQKWPESYSFFPDQTQNSYLIPFTEVRSWPKEKIALFDGLGNTITGITDFEQVDLVLYTNGFFQVYKQRKLASGRVSFSENKWNRLMLKFQDDTITGSVNGKEICRVQDTIYTKGYSGFGTGWHVGLFDNVNIIHAE